MKSIWLWLIAATAGFIMLLWGWLAIPIDDDFPGAMFSGALAGPSAYDFYRLLGLPAFALLIFQRTPHIEAHKEEVAQCPMQQ